MAIERLSIATNLKRMASTQYSNFNFNSMCMFNGVALGANSDGIYSLFDADDDDGTDIDAFFELLTTDFGTLKTKKVRFVHVGLESSGDLKIKFQVDEGTEQSFIIPAKKIGQLQHRAYRVDGRNDLRGTYWRARVENTGGCDFSVDSIEAVLMILGY